MKHTSVIRGVFFAFAILLFFGATEVYAGNTVTVTRGHQPLYVGWHITGGFSTSPTCSPTAPGVTPPALANAWMAGAGGSLHGYVTLPAPTNVITSPGGQFRCQHTSGASDSAWLIVNDCTAPQVWNGSACATPAAPTVSITSSSNNPPYNTPVTITWTVSGTVNPGGCTASGAWSGSKNIAGGSEPTGNLTSPQTYTLTCTGPGGTNSASVPVNPAAPAACPLPWGGSIPHGNVVTAYQTPSVTAPSACVPQSRTCTNGTLSGSYTNQTCVVNPAPSPVITITPGGGGSAPITGPGINCPGDCTEPQTPSTPITLTATPTGGSQVVSWTWGGSSPGSCGAGNSCNIPMPPTGPVPVTVTINPGLVVTPTSNPTSGGTGSITSTDGGISNCTISSGDCTQPYTTGTWVTLNATPSSGGHTFGGWGGSASSCGMNPNNCQVQINTNTIVTCDFDPPAGAPVPNLNVSNPTPPNNTSVNLTWTVTGSVTSCSIDNGIGNVATPSGSTPTPPLTTPITYTLTCTGPGGTAQDTVTVTPGAAPTADLVPQGLTVPGPGTQGTPMNLSASVRNAGTVGTGIGFSNNFSYRWGASGAWTDLPDIAKPALGAGANGSVDNQSFTPAQSGTLYIQYCVDSNLQINEGAGGEGNNCTVSGAVTVNGASAPVVSLSASNLTPPNNTSVTLTWTVSGTVNPGGCTASGGWSGSKNIAGGSEATGNLTSSQTYTLTCTGPGGNGSDFVTVNPAAPVYSCTGSIAPGGVAHTGDTTGLGANTPWTYSQSGSVAKCEFYCPGSTVYAAGSCQSLPTIDQFEVCEVLNPTNCVSGPGEITVSPGADLTVNWQSTGAAAGCSGTKFTTGNAQDGTVSPVKASNNPSDSDNFVLRCSIDGTAPTSVSETIVVKTLALKPDLIISPRIVEAGVGTVSLSWDTKNPLTGGEAACTLTGGGKSIVVSGAIGTPSYTSGSLPAFTINGRTTFTLTCGTLSDVETVDVVPVGWES